jgi:hypothetical protein
MLLLLPSIPIIPHFTCPGCCFHGLSPLTTPLPKLLLFPLPTSSRSTPALHTCYNVSPRGGLGEIRRVARREVNLARRRRRRRRGHCKHCQAEFTGTWFQMAPLHSATSSQPCSRITGRTGSRSKHSPLGCIRSGPLEPDTAQSAVFGRRPGRIQPSGLYSWVGAGRKI